MHVPSQPLMRPPLSRFQTPADTSQCGWFFRVWQLRRVTSLERATQHTSGQLLLRCQPFSAVDEGNPNIEMRDVNAQGWCKLRIFWIRILGAQLAEKAASRL